MPVYAVDPPYAHGNDSTDFSLLSPVVSRPVGRPVGRTSYGFNLASLYRRLALVVQQRRPELSFGPQDNLNRHKLLFEAISLIESMSNELSAQPTVPESIRPPVSPLQSSPIQLTVSLAWLQTASTAEIAALTRRQT